jgi:hypothetical protein
MPIHIVKTAAGYAVTVSPPDGPSWASDGELTATEVLERLSELGCRSTDISDALSTADPYWTDAHNLEVSRRRRVSNDAG